MARSTIYILYNAKASVVGKLDYARRKLAASTETSPCSACDLTHGGLRLSETADWKVAKQRIDANVEQLHQDELTSELAEYIKANNIQYPSVLGRADGGELKQIVDAATLNTVSKDHDAFLKVLVEGADEKDIPLKLHDKS